MKWPNPPNGGKHDRLRAIERHLASFLSAGLLEHIWHEGFAQVRQPSFRLNALRLGTEGVSSTGRQASGSQEGAQPPSTEYQEKLVQQLLAGFGLDPAATPVETCPYYPLARLLPQSCAAAVRVPAHVHSLEPLRTGSVYFMSLSSMLPALALMGHREGAAATGAGAEAAVPAAVAAGGAPADMQGPGGVTAAYGNPSADSGTGTTAHCLSATPGCDPYLETGPDGDQRNSGGSSKTGGSSGFGGSAGGLRVLDLCAAPGGKTALLAELMGNQGTLVAVDANWPRLQRLQFNVSRLVPPAPEVAEGVGVLKGSRGSGSGRAAGSGPWRHGCVVAVHTDGRRLQVDRQGLPLTRSANRGGLAEGKGGALHSTGGVGRGAGDDDEEEAGAGGGEAEVGGVYHRVLVDAPCSGLGRLQLERPDSFSFWDERLGESHARRQRRLALRGVQLLRAGGSLVYSTCTISPQENEEVVAWLLARVQGLRLIEPRLPPAPSLVYPAHLAPPTRQGALLMPIGLQPLPEHAPFPFGWSGAAPTGGPTSTPYSWPARAWVPGDASGGLLCGSSGPTLRAALEAHRPGCTYPALVDGPAWAPIAAAAAAGAAEGSRRPNGRGRGRHDGFGAAQCAWEGVPAPKWRPGGSGEEALRNQLATCLRVAPGLSYEGFFLAQFVKS